MFGAIIGAVASIGGAILGAFAGSKDTERQLEASQIAAEQAAQQRAHELQLAKEANRGLVIQRRISLEQNATKEDLAKVALIGIGFVTIGAAGIAVITT